MALVKHSNRTIRKPCRKCGRTDLYWAHDTSVIYDDAGKLLPTCRESAESGGKPLICDNPDAIGKFQLIEKDGSAHTHPSDAPKRNDWSPSAETPAVTPPEVVPAPWDAKHPNLGDMAEERRTREQEAAKPADDKMAALSGLLDILAPKVDRKEVEAIVAEAVANIVQPTRTVVIKPETDPKKVEGATHSALADVIQDLGAGEHVLMVGPAGTGKSTIAEQAAEALSLPYFSVSLNPGMTATQLVGYMQATGDYVRTLYREAYENGGVFHFDEFDNAHPSTLAVINASLANGMMAFPDQMIKRHADFRCVASANTYGRGADRQYVGRQQIDGATLDRFAVETIDIDPALEQTLCLGTGLDAAKVSLILKYIRKLRSNAAEHKMTVIVSPRASIGMCRLIYAGKTVGAAIESRVRRGLSAQDWSKLTAGTNAPVV